MHRRACLLVLLTAAFGGILPSSAEAHPRRCGPVVITPDSGNALGDAVASHIGCPDARRLLREWALEGYEPRTGPEGFACRTVRRYPAGIRARALREDVLRPRAGRLLHERDLAAPASAPDKVAAETPGGRRRCSIARRSQALRCPRATARPRSSPRIPRGSAPRGRRSTEECEFFFTAPQGAIDCVRRDRLIPGGSHIS